MKKIGFKGLGAYTPKKTLTNADLQKMVDTSDEWISSRTGIKQRRIAAKDEPSSAMALKASEAALKSAGLKPQEIDLAIVATITPDMPLPSTACLLQSSLGLKNAVCMDISAACAGFIYALVFAQQSIITGLYKNALVVGTEKMSSITDWKDRQTCVLFGDGAGAAVLSEVKSGGILSVHLGSDGTMADILNIPAGGSKTPASHQTINNRMHYTKMRGNELFKIAVNTMSAAALAALKKASLKCQDIDLFIPHQANDRIISAVGKKLGLPAEKIFKNIAKYGNMSSASTIVALYEAVAEGRVKKGDTVVLDAFGAGLVWGACVINW